MTDTEQAIDIDKLLRSYSMGLLSEFVGKKLYYGNLTAHQRSVIQTYESEVKLLFGKYVNVQAQAITHLVNKARLDELILMREQGDKYVSGKDIDFEGLSSTYDNHILKRLADLTEPKDV